MERIKNVFRNISKKMLVFVAVFSLTLYNILPIVNVSADRTVNLVISFRYDTQNNIDSATLGHVEYSVNGTDWESITANTSSTGVAIAVPDNSVLAIKVIPNENYRTDFTAMTYTEDSNAPVALSDQSAGYIAGGLTGQNGFFVNDPNVGTVKVENIEFREDDNGGQGGGGPQFNGRAYLIWSCGDDNEGICYHLFDDLTDGTRTKYYAASTITDDDVNGEHDVFNLNAQSIGFVTETAFGEYMQFVQDNNVDLSNMTAEKVLRGTVDQHAKEQELLDNGICEAGWDFRECYENHITIVEKGIGLDPMEGPIGNSSYTSFADRNFKATIYDNNYVAVTLGDTDSFEYFPYFWNEQQFPDAIDLTGTTKANPAQMEAVLVEDTITIKSKGINGVQFSKVEPLDVPSGAVTVAKNGNDFAITFSSHFYDRVIFKITDTNNKVYYLRIARITAKVYDNFGPGQEDPRIEAQVYYDANTSYEDYEVYMTFIKEDNTYVKVKATHDHEFRNSLGDPETDEADGERDHKLKFSQWSASAPEGTIGAYVNVVKAGSTESNYAGTFNGSGRGSYYDINTRKVDYSK